MVQWLVPGTSYVNEPMVWRMIERRFIKGGLSAVGDDGEFEPLIEEQERLGERVPVSSLSKLVSGHFIVNALGFLFGPPRGFDLFPDTDG